MLGFNIMLAFESLRFQKNRKDNGSIFSIVFGRGMKEGGWGDDVYKRNI